MKRPFVRRLLLTAVVVVLALPLLVPGAIGSMKTMSTSPTSWIPPSLPQRRQYDEFIRHFERESAVILSWPGCTLDDPRLARLADAFVTAETSDKADGDKADGESAKADANPARQQDLHGEADDPLRPRTVATAADAPPLIERVLTGPSVLDDLTGAPQNIDREEAVRRLQGFLIGPDGRTTCALAILSDAGSKHRNEAVETIMAQAEACGVPRAEQRIAGAPVESMIIDEESGRTLYQFAIPSALVSLGLCWFCLRSWRYTLAIVIAAGLGEAITLALVYYSGVEMNALLIVMPPLIFVLTVSSGVHLTNYYYEEARKGDLPGAVGRAVVIGWLPCGLAVATTAIGIGSLMVSKVSPVHQFGTFAPLGLIVTVAVLFLILPGTIECWLERPRSAERKGSRQRRREVGRDAPLWDWLWRRVTRNATLVAAGCIGLMLVSAWGLRSLKTSVDVRSLFAPSSRFLRDYNWLDEHVAPLVPIEVVLRIDDGARLDLLERLELVHDTARAVKSLPRVEGVMSAVTYAPDIPEPGGLRHTIRRNLMRKRLGRDLDRFVDSRFLYLADGRQLWRISVRMRPGAEAEYTRYLEELRGRVTPVLERYQSRAGDARTVSVVYTGAMPLTDLVHNMLLRDLYTSFLTAALLVAVVMMVVLRSFGAGLLAMLPNVFPMVLLFGLMGQLGLAVDIGSMMTASIALGIAVDDTLHFLTWYRRETADGSRPVQAIRRCYRHCGRAMVQTTLICGLGLSVFVFSGFLPTQRFCAMILVLLLTALLGDLVFLPALLISPLGRYFLAPRNKTLRSRPETPQSCPAEPSPVPCGAKPHLPGAER